MRVMSLLLLSFLSASAFGQEAECRRGAELTVELEAARAEHGDEHPDVLALAGEIRSLQQALLAANPDQTIAEICDVPAAPAAAAEPAEPDPNEVICRREQVTGTHRRREVCLTRAQREEMRREMQQRMQERRALDP